MAVDEDLRTIADECAVHGCIAAAPDLFWRPVPGPLPHEDNRTRPRFQPRLEKVKAGEADIADALKPVQRGASTTKRIVALYPTPGLDARGAATLRALLREARDLGAGVLVVSEDLDELFELSDRLLVLHNGTIAGQFAPDNSRAEAVGALMVGAGDRTDAA